MRQVAGHACLQHAAAAHNTGSALPAAHTLHKRHRESLLCRLGKAALYHSASCARFVAAAEELQAVLLSRRAAQLRPGALLDQAAILQEARCLFACFSARRAPTCPPLAGALSPACTPPDHAAVLASLPLLVDLPVAGIGRAL